MDESAKIAGSGMCRIPGNVPSDAVIGWLTLGVDFMIAEWSGNDTPVASDAHVALVACS